MHGLADFKSGEKQSPVLLRISWSELYSIRYYCMNLYSYRSVIITVIPSPNLLLLGPFFISIQIPHSSELLGRSPSKNMKDASIRHVFNWSLPTDSLTKYADMFTVYLRIKFHFHSSGSFVMPTHWSPRLFSHALCFTRKLRKKLSQKYFKILEYNTIRYEVTLN